MIKFSFFQGLYFEDILLEQEYEISSSQNLKSKFKIFFGHSAAILLMYFVYSSIVLSPNYYVLIFMVVLFILIFLFHKEFKYLKMVCIFFSISKKVFLFESLMKEINEERIGNESNGIYFFAIYFVLMTINQTCFCSNNALYNSIYFLIFSLYLAFRMMSNYWMGFILIASTCASVVVNLFHEEFRKRIDFLKIFNQMSDLRFYKHILDQEFRAAALVFSSKILKKSNTGFGLYRKFKHKDSKFECFNFLFVLSSLYLKIKVIKKIINNMPNHF